MTTFERLLGPSVLRPDAQLDSSQALGLAGALACAGFDARGVLTQAGGAELQVIGAGSAPLATLSLDNVDPDAVPFLLREDDGGTIVTISRPPSAPFPESFTIESGLRACREALAFAGRSAYLPPAQRAAARHEAARRAGIPEDALVGLATHATNLARS